MLTGRFGEKKNLDWARAGYDDAPLEAIGGDAGDYAGAFGAAGVGAGVAVYQSCLDARHHVDGRHGANDQGRYHVLPG